MRLRNILAAGAFAFSAFAASGAAGNADTQAGFYLAYSPGAFVEYLSLTDSGRKVSGYLEAIRASHGAPDGQVRTQTFAKANGSSLSFGASNAVRTTEGYTLTSMSQEGSIVQIRFKRATAQAVNAAIVAFSGSAGHTRLATDPLPAKVTPPAASPLSPQDAARLAAADAAVDAAEVQLRAAQAAADKLSAVAHQARLDANAAVEKSGVSQAQNKFRNDALKAADDAELNANTAKHTVDTVAANVGIARTASAQLKSLVAEAAERARVASGHLSTNDRVGP